VSETGERAVWSWSLDELLAEIDLLPAGENYEGLRVWADRAYATDIFLKDARPSIGSVLVGFTTKATKRVLSLGVIETVAGIATGKVRATVGSLIHLPPDMGFGLTRDESDSLTAQTLRPAPLSRAMADALLRRLADSSDEVRAWLAEVSRQPVLVDGDSGQRLREEHDAIRVGIELSGVQLPSSAFASYAEVSEDGAATALLDGNLFEDNEDDLLFADLRRFDQAGALTALSASTSRYVDGDIELLIANVNRKPIEHTLGVDLLYWDMTSNSYTLIQYKRLTKERVRRGGQQVNEWLYRRRDELEKQVAKMRTLVASTSLARDDWRIVSNPFWFKFVRTDAFDPESDEVLKGMYVPSDFIEQGLNSDWFRDGINGGFEIGYDNCKYVTRGSFLELVKKGLSGSAGTASAEIAQIISDLAPSRDLIVVRKSRSPLRAPITTP
jgi:hypothetical protein